MSTTFKLHSLAIMLLCLTTLSSSLPATTSVETVKKDIESPVNGSTWSYYHTAALTVAVVVVSVGLAALTALFFPVFVYKICYALGGCQDTMDRYVDQMIGVEGTTRKINRRSLMEFEGPILSALAQAAKLYGPVTNNHSVHKRSTDVSGTPSAIDYFEPILNILSKGYEQYLDDDTKKNFKKLSYTR